MRYVAKTTTKFLGMTFQNVTIDNRAEVLGNLLSQFYRGLMEQIWQHAAPQEFASLIPQATELKERAASGRALRERVSQGMKMVDWTAMES